MQGDGSRYGTVIGLPDSSQTQIAFAPLEGGEVECRAVGPLHYSESKYLVMNYANRRGNKTDPGRSKNRKPRPPNTGSKRLTNSENEQLFALMDRSSSVSLRAGQITLRTTRGGDCSRWAARGEGTLVFAKDYRRRLYALQLWDIRNQRCLWEHKLFEQFHVQCDPNHDNLITFEGESCTYGLDFLYSDEAASFQTFFDRYKMQLQSTDRKKPAYTASLERDLNVPNSPSSSIERFSSTASSTHNHDHNNGNTMFGITRLMQNLASLTPSVRRKEEKKQKIRKMDISDPQKFEHKAHIGFTGNGAQLKTVLHKNSVDDSVKDILRAAGHNPEQMCKDDLRFASEFVSKYQLVDKNSNDRELPSHHSPVKNRIGRSSSSVGAYTGMPPRTATMLLSAKSYRPKGRPTPPPPPPPMPRERAVSLSPASATPAEPPAHYLPIPAPRSSPATSNAPLTLLEEIRAGTQLKTMIKRRKSATRPVISPPPPPTPSAVPCPCKATTELSADLQVEIRSKKMPQPANRTSVTPVSGATGPPPPPPCPPPPPLVLRSARSQRNNLLEEIKTAQALKPVGKITRSATIATSCGRDDMMLQIRQGVKLKPVVPEERPKPTVSNMGFLAGALARALAERRDKVISPSSDSQSETDHGDSEWDEA
ncbi:hypothetical protein QR680_018573 [Steinernema hermaphroditum]|uniref:WH1 domain-containing protein n=1 Tax=Steinernema hermaphroditum TaxID=289476 RepID=A0AA39HJ87_9BILA|nr:hypothetical protein QR680_018573 [Steinernema hermaphroditum]